MTKKKKVHPLRTVFSLVLLAALIIGYKAFPYQSVEVISSSMEPTILKGDRVFELPFKEWEARRIQRGDIISLKARNENGFNLVKRVIALEGDQVLITKGKLYINKEKVDEPYLMEEFMQYDYGPKIIPAGEIFVLGDNRNESEDSSVWGTASKEDTLGRIVFVYYPKNRFGADLKIPSRKK